MTVDLTTVTPEYAVLHDSRTKIVVKDLEPGQLQHHHGHRFETLPDLGDLRSRFATVNDVHFGEVRCGVTSNPDMGPIYTSDEENPHPEFMNRGAIEEIEGINPDAVLVKGDLTDNGSPAQYEKFLQFYAGAFAEKLYHQTGNHDAYYSEDIQPGKQICVELPGVTLAMIDTVKPGLTGGTCYDHDLQWLDELARETTQPVLVFGHHQVWDPATPYRSADYFGIQPDESEKLIELFSRRAALRAYLCGHTHRNRVRRFPVTGDVPWIEVACVKDFPGSWAEYRVCAQGILQIHHRISTPEALQWSEKTRDMYNGSYFDYAFGKLSDRCLVVTRF